MTKTLGILPLYRGEYAEGTTYYKMNIVGQYGSQFIYTGGASTTTAPCTKTDTAITPNTGWQFFSDASADYFAAINEAERKTAETARQEAEVLRELRSKETVSATTAANTAATNAETATNTANDAAQRAEDSADRAADAITNAETATTAANAAAEAANAVSDELATIQRDLAQYEEADPLTLASGQSGKYIDTTGAVKTNSAYSISTVVDLQKGNIYLIKPSTSLITGVALCAEYTTDRKEVVIEYTYTYNDDGTIATATADYDTTLKYTYAWSNGVATITDKSGTVVDYLPQYRTVEAGSYVPLFKNLSTAAPKSGYYAVLANESCKAVFSLPTADITTTVVVASYGIFRSIVNNKEDKAVVKKLQEQVATLESDNETLWNAIGSTLEGETGYLLLAKAGTTVLGKAASKEHDTWLRIKDDTSLNKWPDTESLGQRNVLAVAYSSVVKGMSFRFFNCKDMTRCNSSLWDTSSVTSFQYTFNNCSSLQSLDVSGWDTSGVTNMSALFSGCSSLQSLDVSGWDTSVVTSFQYTFSNCSSLQSLDVSGWDTSNVTNMGWMFRGCPSLRYITLGAGFFNTTQALPFNGADNLGLNADGTDNGWLAHLAETAPTITDGTARTIQLPTKLKALSTSEEYITTLQTKGYTVA